MANHKQQTETAEVLISEVIGTGAAAHRLATCGDWTFTLPGESGVEPEIPDTVLAARLGLDLDKLRELSGRHEKAGNIRPRRISPTVGDIPRGRGRPGVQRFYSEADALFLVTRSETPKAVALTREMIRVYMAVRQGLIPQRAGGAFVTPEQFKTIAVQVAQVMGPMIASAIQPVAEHTLRTNHRVDDLELQVRTATAANSAEVMALRSEVETLRAQVSAETVGPEGAAKILASLRRITALYSDEKARRRVRRSVENELRAALDFNGPGTRWQFLPKRDAARAEKLLGLSLDQHIARRRPVADPAQLPLNLKN